MSFLFKTFSFSSNHTSSMKISFLSHQIPTHFSRFSFFPWFYSPNFFLPSIPRNHTRLKYQPKNLIFLLFHEFSFLNFFSVKLFFSAISHTTTKSSICFFFLPQATSWWSTMRVATRPPSLVWWPSTASPSGRKYLNSWSFWIRICLWLTNSMFGSSNATKNSFGIRGTWIMW